MFSEVAERAFQDETVRERLLQALIALAKMVAKTSHPPQDYDKETRQMKPVPIEQYYDTWPWYQAKGVSSRFMEIVGDGGHAPGWKKPDELAIETWQCGIQSWLLYHFFTMDVEGVPPVGKKTGITQVIRQLRRHFDKDLREHSELKEKLKEVGGYFQHHAAFESLGLCYQKCKQGQEIEATSVQCEVLGGLVRNVVEAWILDSVVRLSEDTYCLFKPYESIPVSVMNMIDPHFFVLLGDEQALDPTFREILITFTNTVIGMSQQAEVNQPFIHQLVEAGNAYLGPDTFQAVLEAPNP